jgi:hypothetical protein
MLPNCYLEVLFGVRYPDSGDTMAGLYVVISGIPGSGKTTLARRLAPALGVPLIDKDDILERLFETRGIGDSVWRRALSRESDGILQADAMASDGAVLVSHWHVPGIAADSGTPTGWLADLPGALVHVRCVCDPAVAARRFLERRRHAGHLDGTLSAEDLEDRFRTAGVLDIHPRIDEDTAGSPNAGALVREIRARSGLG